MSRLKRAMFLVLLVIVVVAGCGPSEPGKSATLESAVDHLFPPRSFGKVKDAQCATDPPGDFGFATGEAPGRHDPWVDIRRACGATVKTTPALINQIETRIPCGPTPDGGLVVCSSSNPLVGNVQPPLGTSGELVLFGIQVKGDIPLQAPLEETGRLSVFIAAGGDAKTKSQKTAEAPDSASQGTNVTYQVIFNDPGTNVVDMGLLSVDRRTPGEFFQTGGRVWIHGNIVTFVIPKSEIGDVMSLRGAVFWGSRSAQGDASKGNQKVVPGGAHPRGFIRYTG